MSPLIRDVVTILLTANGVVTLAVAFNASFSRAQKLWQILLVWLLPGFGAFGIGMFLAQQGSSPRIGTTHHTPGPDPLTLHSEVQSHRRDGS